MVPIETTSVHARSPKVLFVVSDGWYFRSHRLYLAKAAMDQGFEVHVATRTSEGDEAIGASGIALHELPWKRGGRFLDDLRSAACVARLIDRLKPAIVHAVSLKPIVLAALGALPTASRPHFVHAITGLGYAFADDSLKARIVRRIILQSLSTLADRPGSVYLFQNNDDREVVKAAGAAKRAASAIIRGAGIDVLSHPHVPPPDAPPLIVATVTRMLGIKGVADVVEASRLLDEQSVAHRTLLVGKPDLGNPSALSHEVLVSWAQSPSVTYVGHVDDPREIWAKSHVAILASRGGEGLPKALLEAAACGRPMVATDVPGNREIVVDGETGFLVPPRDPEALAAAVRRLAGDAELRRRMGGAARERAERLFSSEVVARETIALYRSMLV
ncbi:glycosyltransferase family 4 protein [Salinarimonas ramus]|uniref:Glycosyl transferase family 1 n=1 Tax=Salinarimonas ramus TaxID=690164 RepID=A0A917QFV9_9HYPH|nr:glycosyltransferase family 4 protein [Salinarimonas ramus]GGK47070.1 glycosyl transferase family 1 [Salinarimonas ramus]